MEARWFLEGLPSDELRVCVFRTFETNRAFGAEPSGISKRERKPIARNGTDASEWNNTTRKPYVMKQTRAVLTKWNRAVKEARDWLRTHEGFSAWQVRKEGVKRIKEALEWPEFSFKREGWVTFYAILELGHLIPIYRDRIFRKKSRFKAGLVHLINEDFPIEERLQSVLSRDGRFHISGLGPNTVSKILAVHDPLKWPVYNTPVKATLRWFGYMQPSRAGIIGRYVAFAKTMGEFRKACGAKDVLALDAFFYY